MLCYVRLGYVYIYIHNFFIYCNSIYHNFLQTRHDVEKLNVFKFNIKIHLPNAIDNLLFNIITYYVVPHYPYR